MTAEPACLACRACRARSTPQMPPLRLAEPLQHRRAPLVAAPLVQQNQVLILHLLEEWQRNKDFDTYHLLRWAMLRLHVLLDATAAALDARRLPTFANTGDCATRLGIQALISICGTSTLLISSSDPLNKRTNHTQFERYQTRNTRNTRHTPASVPRGRPLRDATSPSERSLRSQRFVVASGTPSAAAIFLAQEPRVAMRSMAKRSSVDRTML